MIARACTRLVLLSLALLAGCRHDVTEVVLVVQSDLTVPSEANAIDVASIEGPFSPQVNPFFGNGTVLPTVQTTLMLRSQRLRSVFATICAV